MTVTIDLYFLVYERTITSITYALSIIEGESKKSANIFYFVPPIRSVPE